MFIFSAYNVQFFTQIALKRIMATKINCECSLVITKSLENSLRLYNFEHKNCLQIIFISYNFLQTTHYSETVGLNMLLICFESQRRNLNSQTNTIWEIIHKCISHWHRYLQYAFLQTL